MVLESNAILRSIENALKRIFRIKIWGTLFYFYFIKTTRAPPDASLGIIKGRHQWGKTHSFHFCSATRVNCLWVCIRHMHPLLCAEDPIKCTFRVDECSFSCSATEGSCMWCESQEQAVIIISRCTQSCRTHSVCWLLYLTSVLAGGRKGSNILIFKKLKMKDSMSPGNMSSAVTFVTIRILLLHLSS